MSPITGKRFNSSIKNRIYLENVDGDYENSGLCYCEIGRGLGDIWEDWLQITT